MPSLLTLEEIAAQLRCCPETVRRYAQRGSLPAVRMPGSRRLLFDPNEVFKAMRSGANERADSHPASEFAVAGAK